MFRGERARVSPRSVFICRAALIEPELYCQLETLAVVSSLGQSGAMLQNCSISDRASEQTLKTGRFLSPSVDTVDAVVYCFQSNADFPS